MPNVLILDKSPLGGRYEANPLDLPRLGERIALNVGTHVGHGDNVAGDRCYGLVYPNDLEQRDIGSPTRPFRSIAADHQVQVTLQTFRKDRFLAFAPDVRVERGDQTSTLRDDEKVGFLRLVPMVAA